MAARNIVLVGDTTSHGGVVMTGSPHDQMNGRRVACLGDEVHCPQHGVNRIVEGDTSTLLDGRPIALEGHRTQCGSTLKGGGNGSVG